MLEREIFYQKKIPKCTCSAKTEMGHLDVNGQQNHQSIQTHLQMACLFPKKNSLRNVRNGAKTSNGSLSSDERVKSKNNLFFLKKYINVNIFFFKIFIKAKF